MPAITLAQFRSAIRDQGGYANSRVFTDAFLNTQVNRALGKYSALLDKTWEGYRDKTGTVSTVANTATVALPTDFLNARAVDRLESDRYVPLTKIQIRQSYAYEGQRERPVAYMHVGANLELFPTPNAVYTIRLRYRPTVTQLTSDSDSIDIPAGWEEYPLQLALLVCDQRDEKPLNERLALIAEARDFITGAAEDRNTAEPDYIPFPGEEHARWYP